MWMNEVKGANDAHTYMYIYIYMLKCMLWLNVRKELYLLGMNKYHGGMAESTMKIHDYFF